jgi:hypothetical protein
MRFEELTQEQQQAFWEACYYPSTMPAGSTAWKRKLANLTPRSSGCGRRTGAWNVGSWSSKQSGRGNVVRGATRTSRTMPASTTVLGIDPGISGALCLMSREQVLMLDDLPVHNTQHGRSAKVRAELDLHTLRARLTGETIGHCFLEQVDARPGQGVVSMFRFGQSLGALYGLLVGLQLPCSFVRPQRWQRFHGIGASPDAARQRAVQLYPKLAPMLQQKRDQHRADAVLLAAFGLATEAASV